MSNVAQKYLGLHARVSSRFGETQRAYTAKQEEAADARRREVRAPLFRSFCYRTTATLLCGWRMLYFPMSYFCRPSSNFVNFVLTPTVLFLSQLEAKIAEFRSRGAGAVVPTSTGAPS